MKKYVLLSIVVSLGLTACGKKSQHSVELDNSIQSNKEANSYLEWETSAFNPEKLFAEWNRKLVAKEIEVSGLCESLTELGAEELVTFENEIRKEDNMALVKDCRGSLITKMDEYWQSQKPANVSINGQARLNNFTFPDNVQYRDLSNGYFAYSGDVASKEVVLTFDDGPSNLYTENILNTMAQVNAKALFFMTGNNVKRYSDIVQKVADHGHAVGGHSMGHQCLAANNRCQSNNHGKMFSVAEAMKDIRGTFEAIFKAIGYVDPFFRFPYGESSPELKAQLRANQTGEFYWAVDSEDWRSYDKSGQPWTPGRMIEAMMSQLNNSSKKRGILLFHDIQKKTAEALPTLLNRLYHDGYSVVLLKAEDSRMMSEPTILKNKSQALVP